MDHAPTGGIPDRAEFPWNSNRIQSQPGGVRAGFHESAPPVGMTHSHLDQTPKQLVTSEVVASRLGVQPDTIRRWALDGRIPVYRIGLKTLRFDLDEVLAAIRADREGGIGDD